MNKKVNLFIIGAPKCGTTSLANYLGQSESILLSEIKEPHFFRGSLPGPYSKYVSNIETYENLFKKSPRAKRQYWLDASVWYYSNEGVADEIYRYNPEAKLIMLIRNPQEAILSLFKHRVAALNENQRDINTALRLIKERKEGKGIPPVMKTTMQGLFYIENYQYAERLRRFREVFQSNLKIILFEDLTKDPETVLVDICSWLQIPSTLFSLDIRHNTAKKGRSKIVSKALHAINPSFKRILKRSSIVSGLMDAVTGVIPHKELKLDYNDESLLMLRENLNPDIEEMEVILKKDLNHWKL